MGLVRLLPALILAGCAPHPYRPWVPGLNETLSNLCFQMVEAKDPRPIAAQIIKLGSNKPLAPAVRECVRTAHAV